MKYITLKYNIQLYSMAHVKTIFQYTVLRYNLIYMYSMYSCIILFETTQRKY